MKIETEWRFISKISIKENNECWEWQAIKSKDNYGVFETKGKHIAAHRYAWELANGPIPAGMLACHKCDNRLCCNPNHIFIGTHKDNMQDMVLKGRSNKLKGIQKPQAKLTIADIYEIRASSNKLIDLAKKYGVRDSAISKIKLRQRWKHLP